MYVRDLIYKHVLTDTHLYIFARMHTIQNILMWHVCLHTILCTYYSLTHTQTHKRKFPKAIRISITKLRYYYIATKWYFAFFLREKSSKNKRQNEWVKRSKNKTKRKNSRKIYKNKKIKSKITGQWRQKNNGKRRRVFNFVFDFEWMASYPLLKTLYVLLYIIHPIICCVFYTLICFATKKEKMRKEKKTM